MKRAVGVYIAEERSDGAHILLARRSELTRYEHGSWEGIGGIVDPEESFEDAARREVREAVGVKITRLLLLKRYASISDATGETWQAQKYLASVEGIPSVVGETHDQIGWFRPNEMSDVLLASYDRNDLEILQSGIVEVWARAGGKPS